MVFASIFLQYDPAHAEPLPLPGFYMASRQVLPTDRSLKSGQPVPRAYLTQLNDEFAQSLANLIGSMDDIVHSPDMPAHTKVNAAKEMRFLIAEQMKLLAEIERLQDAHEIENKSKNLKQMVSDNPAAALEFVDKEIGKLTEFREWIKAMVVSNESISLAVKSQAFKELPMNEEPF